MSSHHQSEQAAAEMVGALVLIALFIAAIAIITVVLFSQPAPDKIPAVSMAISNQSTLIAIAHDGGETLTYEDIIVRVDGEEVPAADLVCLNCGSAFSVGDTIQIDLSGDPRYSGPNLGITPNKVDVIYIKGGEEHQLMTTRYLGTMAPTPTPGTIPTTATPLPTTTVITTTTTPPTTPPVADFTGNPLTGTSPLTVAFTDLSTNSPSSWLWNFGDGDATNATIQNPVHTFAAPGTYSVNLTATNSAGHDSENKTAYITVTLPPTMRILENANKPSNVVSGGYLQFRVNGASWPSISHGGVWRSLNNNDVVRLVTGSDTKGQIYIASGRITSFAFDDVRLYINGADFGTGTVSSIWVTRYDNLVSTLTLDTPSYAEWTRFEVNSIPIIPSVTNNSRIQVFNLKPHSGGTLNLDNRATTYYDGGADAYSLTPAATAPVAGFTGTPTSGSRPLTVQFTDTSTNTPTSWQWNFGDTSFENYTVRNPQHTFANAGDYTITLTATNSAGSDSFTRTNYITVNSVTPPVAGFSGTPTTGARPLSVRFSDTSTNTPTSWSWNFGDGNTSGNTLQNPVHLYVLPGTYTVSLMATNAGGSNTLTRTNYITVSEIPPVAEFTGTPRSGVEPLTVSFTDLSTNSPTSWLWDFGDGTTSTEQNPTHQYMTDGRYRVRLTATNSAGSDTETKNNYIDVDTFTADFSYTYEEVPIFPPFWYGYEVDFTDTSNGIPVSWSWNFDGGSGSTTIQNPQDVFYWFGGNYDVTLTVTNSVGTTATVTKRVRLT